MNKKTLFQFCTLTMLAAAASGQALADDKIVLNYNVRPPYIVEESDGSASGLTASPAANAFKSAGVAFTWAKAAPNRQLAMVQENTQKTCAIGWYKTEEREGFAKFSKALYRDKPTVMIISSGFKIKDHAKLEDVLTMPGIKVLIKEKFSYGHHIDAALAKLKPQTVVSNGTNTQMLQLIAAKSADLMFAAPEEANYLIEQSNVAKDKFSQFKASDMPDGGERYLICSKNVPDEVIAKLNKGISFK
ncbi:transporter substrate-binding domain-containing protein [Undibacterium sp. CY18W]|uniref:Transporter substrate-binding domain-containing protein n=1 Tax=Undibacterium hunanense TaxID=2762292 RepID=A0ABR6ZXI5_9BURK|nr:transporter substrate-binding domain-containing protein [Undibacterium hunanense]MBC3920369.1 transporter substrate-binding domain-containing protein [Undibacterium hunanense]